MVSSQEITAMIKRIKQEPPDEETATKKTNTEADTCTRTKRKSEDETLTSPKRFRHYSENGKPTIPCLMCDRYLENQDELMIHMTLDHQCSPQGSRRQAGRIPKHTCQICYAKFRTLRDLFTHTAIHAKQLQLKGEWMSDVGNRVEKSFLKQGAMRQYFSTVQNSLQGEVQLGTFKCDCCNNIFMNRDTYAMHVMMRVKDEMCKQDEIQNGHTKIKGGIRHYGETVDLVSSQNGQEVLIDVTSNVHEDEYLKSAISITENFQRTPQVDTKLQENSRRKCMYCTEHFTDQDSMAMHVMSVHAGTGIHKPLAQTAALKNSLVDQLRKNEPEVDKRMTVKEYFRCHFCGNICESRDSLAMHVLSHTGHNESRTKLSNSYTTDGEESLNKSHAATPLLNDREALSQNEPLNLVSEKNQQRHTVNGEDDIPIQNTKSSLVENVVGIHVAIKPQPSLIKASEARRRTRSASLPDIREHEPIVKRPASTGGITLSDIWKNNLKIAQSQESGTNSPYTYSYEQPEPIVEDREHSCQYIPSPQSDPLQLLLQKREHAHVCGYCEIIFLNRTLFYLHMGLHNVNNPLQCNMCGKTCDSIHDFSAHVMHL